MSHDYEPIACSLHDEYEIAIMQNRCLNIKWLDDNAEIHTAEVRPRDILVKNREEYLLADSEDGQQLYIRLDKITLL